LKSWLNIDDFPFRTLFLFKLTTAKAAEAAKAPINATVTIVLVLVLVLVFVCIGNIHNIVNIIAWVGLLFNKGSFIILEDHNLIVTNGINGIGGFFSGGASITGVRPVIMDNKVYFFYTRCRKYFINCFSPR